VSPSASLDRRILASGSADQTVRLWSLPDGRLIETLIGHGDSVECLAMSPDGRFLASGSTDRTVRLWSLPDGRLIGVLEGHRGHVKCLAISPDGRQEAVGIKAVRIVIEESRPRIEIGESDIEIGR
jgi:WD40 repeat protein